MSGKKFSASYRGDMGFCRTLGKRNQGGRAMRNLLSARLIAAWGVAGLLVFGATAEANPFARFFYSIRHPHHQQVSSHRHKRVGEDAPSASPEIASVRSESTQQNSVERPSPASSREAPLIPARKESDPQLPAGIPVPNKPGFLRSPYGGNQALIDARGFPRGTPVKDPYTGRTFVTP